MSCLEKNSSISILNKLMIKISSNLPFHVYRYSFHFYYGMLMTFCDGGKAGCPLTRWDDHNCAGCCPTLDVGNFVMLIGARISISPNRSSNFVVRWRSMFGRWRSSMILLRCMWKTAQVTLRIRGRELRLW